MMSEIIFEVSEDEIEGGYSASYRWESDSGHHSDESLTILGSVASGKGDAWLLLNRNWSETSGGWRARWKEFLPRCKTSAKTSVP